MKALRCAVYTRKSTDEGLDQAFNSLDAQREACLAYIRSQAGEGWSPVKAAFDDGGYSGGSMERPALQRLMIEIAAGRIDVVVVYKVDRLTRSLADFARIVETLDAAGASFVSVTQAFNTTTSMGRLTLNVLLSFAQFEREVTGERIRDKIAASKAKGMWMGGVPPLGYDIAGRTLRVNDAEADTVRHIYRRYLAVRSVMDLRDELARDGVRSKTWTSAAGRALGGVPFTHGALFHILKNRIYLGDIMHKKRAHRGQHASIVERDTFDAVQAKLLAGAPPRRARTRGQRLPLLGRIFDDRGAPMTSTHATKKGVRYLYYVSTGARRGAVGSLSRVSAPRLHAELSKALLTRLRPDWCHAHVAEARVLAAVGKITLSCDRMVIDIATEALRMPMNSEASENQQLARLEIAVPLHRPLHARFTVNGEAPPPQVDRALVRAVVMARVWADRLAKGEAASLLALAAQEDICRAHAGQILPLASLAPDLVEAILDGRHSPRLSLRSLTREALPFGWARQRAALSGYF